MSPVQVIDFITRPLQKVSLKLRLMILMSLVMVATMIGAGWMVVDNSRTDVESEIQSSFDVAMRLVARAQNNVPNLREDDLTELVTALEGLRHLRVELRGPGNRPFYSQLANDAASESAPAWFVDMVYPQDSPMQAISIATSDAEWTLALTGDPLDEAAEIWEDLMPLLIVLLAFGAGMSVLVYATIWLGLRPLEELLLGFERLESGSFDFALDDIAVVELARINRKFNSMVEVLRKTSEENSRLARHMVDLQEEERRALSRELHDDIAPLLFQIRVSRAEVLTRIEEGRTEDARNKLLGIDATVGQLQNLVRRLLHRLRPLVLEELDIKESLGALVEEWERRESTVDWKLDTSSLKVELDDTIAVTCYRIVQECLTNVARHAEASNVNVLIETRQGVTDSSAESLSIVVEDSGLGCSDALLEGFGIAGMRERVRALGGLLRLSQSPLGGLRVEAEIPLN